MTAADAPNINALLADVADVLGIPADQVPERLADLLSRVATAAYWQGISDATRSPAVLEAVR